MATTTVDPVEVGVQFALNHPSRHNHVYFMRYNNVGVLDSVFAVYLMTNTARLYWMAQEEYNVHNPNVWGADSQTYKPSEHVIDYFLQNGYEAVCVYNSEAHYQYDDVRRVIEGLREKH